MARAHKVAAAKRYIRRQEERYSLFVWAGTAVQEGLVEPSAEERVDRYERFAEERLRRIRVAKIRDYRQVLLSMDPACKQEILAAYRASGIPMAPERLRGYIDSYDTRVVDLAALRALHDEEEREYAETGEARLGNIRYDREGRMLIFRRCEDGLERTADGTWTRLPSGRVVEGLSDADYEKWRAEHIGANGVMRSADGCGDCADGNGGSKQ